MESNLFLSTFALIFVAELPDKTAFAALFLATCHHPFAVFLGAAGAFVIQSFVAVAFGSLLSLLPPQIVHVAAGILFLVFAVMMWRREEPSIAEEVECDPKQKASRFYQSVVSAFMTVFIAEWGDLTQLATATLQAKYHAPLIIFASSTLALWLVTAIGVIVGSQVKKFIQPKLLQRTAATAFTVVGIFLLVKH
ncbi:MAG: TMEM165/GDT1 family protein [Rhizonema sp. NSF051]|nr:TMEM165/GDT1 family protein [Rhizonema sp. NSF051]